MSEAIETQDQEIDHLENGEHIENESDQTEVIDQDQPEADKEAEGDDEQEEVTVSIGDTPAEEDEPKQNGTWLKDFRARHRELQREKRELEQRLAALQAPAQTQQITLGKKPTLDDFEYDAEKYEEALSGWFEKKRHVDEMQAKAQAEQQAQAQQWAAKLDGYGQAKNKLKVQDFDDAEHVVMENLNQTQQGIILQCAENPALLVYALGKNPAKAKELASIKNLAQYTFAMGKLETQLKVAPRKPPAPERTISGTGPVSGSSDSHLERLRAEAEKTGDMTKVIAYKRSKAGK